MFEAFWQFLKGIFAMIWFFGSIFLYFAGVYLVLYGLIKIWKFLF